MVNHKHYVILILIIDISGVPGIGKTATVMEVKNRL
jgi:nucleoside-triphosphatase THEP1